MSQHSQSGKKRISTKFKAAVIALGALNIISGVDTYKTVQASFPFKGLVTGQAEPQSLPYKGMLVAHGLGHGIMRGAAAHMNISLLEAGYCNKESVAIPLFVASLNHLGGIGLLATVTAYGLAGIPGAVVGGAISGVHTAALEISTNGDYFNHDQCAGHMPYNPMKFRL